MQNIIIGMAVVLIFSGCGIRSEQSLVKLEQDLTIERKKKSDLEKKISALEISLARQEIASIRKCIQNAQLGEMTSHFDESQPFQKEREKLNDIILKTPICANEAQMVLDQILSLITHFSNSIADCSGE